MFELKKDKRKGTKLYQRVFAQPDGLRLGVVVDLKSQAYPPLQIYLIQVTCFHRGNRH